MSDDVVLEIRARLDLLDRDLAQARQKLVDFDKALAAPMQRHERATQAVARKQQELNNLLGELASRAREAASVQGQLNNAVAAAGGPLAAAKMALDGVVAGFVLLSAAIVATREEVYRSAQPIEEALKEHARLVKAVENAYKGAEESALKLNRTRLATDIFQLENRTQRLREELNMLAQQGIEQVSRQAPMSLSDTGEVATQLEGINRYKAFTEALRDFQNTVKSGAPDLEGFRATVTAIGHANPELARQADELLRLSNSWEELADKIERAEAANRRALGLFGQPELALADAAEKARRALIQGAPEENAALIRREKLAEIEKNYATRVAWANQQEYGGLAIKREAEVLRKNAIASLTEEDKVTRDAYDNALDRVRNQIEVLELQARSYNKNTAEVARLRTELELKRAAQRAGIELSQWDIAVNEALAKKMGAAAAAARDMAETRRTVEQFGGALVDALTSGADAADRLVSSLGGIGKQLATKSLNKLISGESLMSDKPVGAIQGAAALLGAGALGYQAGTAAGSRTGGVLSGALAGALAGAATGNPIIIVGGAVAGAAAGYFGGASASEQAKQQGYQDNINYAIAARNRVVAAQQDVSTRAGQIAAAEAKFAEERAQAAMQGAGRVAQIEKAHAAERIAQAREFAAQDLAREKQYRDRLLLAITDAETEAGALAIFDRAAQRQREEELRLGGAKMVELEETLAAERLNVSKEFNERLVEQERQKQDALLNIGRGITDYLLGLQTGSESPLSPGARLTQAQSAYNATYALAQGGNLDALARITQDAEAYRQAGSAMYGSTAGYQAIFNQITSQLGALPPVAAATDPIITALAGVVSAVNLTTQAAQGTTTAVHGTTGAVQANTVVVSTQLLAAVQSGSASATAAAMLPSFNMIDSTMDGRISFDEMVAALGPIARDATLGTSDSQGLRSKVAGLLTSAQLTAGVAPLAKDVTIGASDSTGLRSKVAGLLTSAQLTSGLTPIAKDASVAATTTAVGAVNTSVGIVNTTLGTSDSQGLRSKLAPLLTASQLASELAAKTAALAKDATAAGATAAINTNTTATQALLNASQLASELAAKLAPIAKETSLVANTSATSALLNSSQLATELAAKTAVLAKDTTVAGSLTVTQLASELAAKLAPIAKDTSVVGVTSAMAPLAKDATLGTSTTQGLLGKLHSIFTEIDVNGDGYLDKAEAIRLASVQTYLNTGQAANNVHAVNTSIDGAGGTNDILTELKLLNNLLNTQFTGSQLNISGGGSPGQELRYNPALPAELSLPGLQGYYYAPTTTPSGVLSHAAQFTTGTGVGSGMTQGTQILPTSIQDSMLTVLRKIAFNTFAIAHNTAQANSGAFPKGAIYGIYEKGGVIPPFGLGLVSEHSPGGGRFIRAGSEPILVSPHAPVSASDNRAVVMELQETRRQNIVLFGEFLRLMQENNILTERHQRQDAERDKNDGRMLVSTAPRVGYR